MDPFELNRQGLSRQDPQASFRRQVWLQLYLPFAIGALILAAAIVLLWRSEIGQASVWADVSLSLLLLVAMALGLLVLAVLAAATVGIWYAIHELPEPFRRARMAVARAEGSTEAAADKAMMPLIIPSAAWHAMLSALRYLTGIFRREQQ